MESEIESNFRLLKRGRSAGPDELPLDLTPGVEALIKAPTSLLYDIRGESGRCRGMGY